MRYKKAAMPLMTILLAVVLGGAILGAGYAFLLKPYMDKKEIETKTGLDPADTIVCDSDVTPSIDIDAFDAYNPGTAVTEATSLWREKGDIGVSL